MVRQKAKPVWTMNQARSGAPASSSAPGARDYLGRPLQQPADSAPSNSPQATQWSSRKQRTQLQGKQAPAAGNTPSYVRAFDNDEAGPSSGRVPGQSHYLGVGPSSGRVPGQTYYLGVGQSQPVHVTAGGQLNPGKSPDDEGQPAQSGQLSMPGRIMSPGDAPPTETPSETPTYGATHHSIVRRDYLGRRVNDAGEAIPTWRDRQNATSEMTQEEYDALSPLQQAAVQFNGGLLNAAGQGGEPDREAIAEYLQQLGFTTEKRDESQPNNDAALGIFRISEDEYDAFLQLDRLISDEILAQMGDTNQRQQDASTMRWARGDEAAAGAARTRMDARSSADLAAEALAAQLRNTGTESLIAPDNIPSGYSSDGSARDWVVLNSYLNMVDDRWTLTTDDVAAGIAQANAANGTDVSLDEVLNFAQSQLRATDFNRVGNSRNTLLGDGMLDANGEPVTVLDPATIRERYGL